MNQRTDRIGRKKLSSFFLPLQSFHRCLCICELFHSLDTDTVGIVGVGNVALDCARLLLAPLDSLRGTDVTEEWLALRAASRVRRVLLLGRRGPQHVSFTIKEFRELTRLPDCTAELRPEDFTGVREQLGSMERPRKRLTELMLKTMDSRGGGGERKGWGLRLWSRPVRIVPAGDTGWVGGLEVEDTRQQGGQVERLECGLVVRSVGYRATCPDPSLPFCSERGVVPNTGGRVGPGLYTAGWLATGPRGVIIDTMNTAFRVAANIVQDLQEAGPLQEKSGRAGLEHFLHNSTNWKQWLKIDNEEERRGQLKGKPRDKIISINEMLRIAKE